MGGGRWETETGCNLTVLAAARHPAVQSRDWFQQTRKYQARLERPREEGGGRFVLSDVSWSVRYQNIQQTSNNYNYNTNSIDTRHALGVYSSNYFKFYH